MGPSVNADESTTAVFEGHCIWSLREPSDKGPQVFEQRGRGIEFRGPGGDYVQCGERTQAEGATVDYIAFQTCTPVKQGEPEILWCRSRLRELRG